MTDAARPRLVVAAGLIARGRGGAREYLVARRPDHVHLGGAWEFPGGKLEPGEHPESALVRELREEIGVVVDVEHIYAVGHHVYPDREVLLMTYLCRIVEGEPASLQVGDLRWCAASELVTLDVPPADRPVLRRIKQEGAP